MKQEPLNMYLLCRNKSNLLYLSILIIISILTSSCATIVAMRDINKEKWKNHKRIMLITQQHCPLGPDIVIYHQNYQTKFSFTGEWFRRYSNPAYNDFKNRAIKYLSINHEVKHIEFDSGECEVLCKPIQQEYIETAKKEGYTSIVIMYYQISVSSLSNDNIYIDNSKNVKSDIFSYTPGVRLRIYDEYGENNIANVLSLSKSEELGYFTAQTSSNTFDIQFVQIPKSLTFDPNEAVLNHLKFLGL